MNEYLIKDAKLLKKHVDLWNKVSNSIKKELDSKPYTSKKFLNTKIRSDGDEATYFYCRKTPEAGSNYICWLVIVIDSALKKGENYFL